MSPSPADSPGAGLPQVVQAMLEPAFYPGSVTGVELVQTHISFVFLTDHEVFKLKKPVRFSFLDFSTPELRLHYCREEVRLNRRLAADVYLGVVSICDDGRGAGGYRLGGENDAAAVDHAVRMKRLPAPQMFAAILERGEATGEHVDAIARRLVEFHAAADAGPEVVANGSPRALRETMEADFSECDRYRGATIAAAADQALQDFCLRFIDSHTVLLRSRQRRGRIREGHGDLRAEHICFADGLKIIDCIEFDARFRNRDVAAEVAFLAMDIEHLGHPALALRLVDRYAAESGDSEVPFLVPFYQCYYAYIRGKVESLKSLEEEVGLEDRRAAARDAARHFAQARRYTAAYTPALLVVSGLSGSGKTTVAESLAGRLGFAHFNSDVVRKQLAGLPTDRPSPAAAADFLYSAELSRRTYERMRDLAREQLIAGRGVILDATFQRREHRAAIDDLARQLGVPIVFVECRCDEAAIGRRLARRSRAGVGPSDADWQVYVQQRRNYEEFAGAELDRHLAVDTEEPLEEIAERVEEFLKKSFTTAQLALHAK